MTAPSPRLLFLSGVFPSPYHPTRGVFNLDLLRALARSHEVRAVVPLSWVEEARARRSGASAIPGRRAVVGGIDTYYPRFYYSPKVFRARYDRFLWLSVGGPVRRLVREFAPDAILSYWAHPDGAVAIRAAREAGVPAVAMIGGSDVLLLTADRARREAVRKVLQKADAVVAVSRDLAAKVVGLGARPEDVHVVGRGVDPEKFAPGDRAEARRRLGLPVEGRLLAWVGRMVEVKGLDILMEAASLLKARGVAFRLALVGDGPLRSSLEADARARGLSGSVLFAGARPHDQLADWYRAADYAVLPSRSEGVPNVLREALACGTPFVASRVGGIPEIADDPGCRLVPPEDPEALAVALEEALGAGTVVARPRPESLEDAAAALAGIIRGLRAPATAAPRAVPS